MRIISKKEVYTEANSSLAGTSAIRFYVDGNITFSRMASDLMEFDSKPYFQLAKDDRNQFYLVPNIVEGYKPTQRMKKYTYILNSKPLSRYLSTCLNKKIEKGKPLELKIESCSKKIEGRKVFKLIIQKELK